MEKKVTILLITIMITIAVLASSAFAATSSDGADTQSTDDVYWLTTRANVYEHSLQQFRIVIEETTSTLNNFELNVTGAKIIEMQNPSGCTVTDTTASCPTESLPKVYVNISEVEEDTNFTWQLMTNDTTDGIEYWNLTLEVLNDISNPTITSISPSENTTLENETITFTILGTDAQNQISTANLYYQLTSNFQDTVNQSNGTTLSFTCVDNNCTADLETTDLSQSTFLDAIIELVDLAGNTIQRTIHYFIDLSAPSISETDVTNQTTNDDSITLTLEVQDDSLSQSQEYNSQINCTINFDNITSQSIITSENTNLTYEFNLSTLGDGTYNWQASCVDSTNNQVASQHYSVTIDNQGPNISCTQDGQNIAQNETINVTVTDAYSSISQVNASYTYVSNNTNQTIDSQNLSSPYQITTENWDEQTATIQITTIDNLGNENTNVCAVTIDMTNPVVTDVTLTTINESAIQVGASADEELTYYLYIGTSNESLSLFNQTSQTNLSYVLDNLNSGTTYFLQLESCDTANNCVNSSILSTTTNSITSSSSSGGSGGGGGSSRSRTIEEEVEIFECNDGIDNDGDGLIDDPADPGCTIATDNSEDSDVPRSEQEQEVQAQEEELGQDSAIQELPSEEQLGESQQSSQGSAGALTGAAVATSGAFDFKNFSIAGKVTAIGIPLILLLILLFYFLREHKQKQGKWH